MAAETQENHGSSYDSTYSERSPSPSPSASPSLALNAPSSTFENRSISVASSFTSVSTSRSVSGDGYSRRRGYIRPQQTAFADSAKQRDSVMSLGTIAHLQYYFARTGLLDGKGAQFAKEAKKKTNAPDTLGTRADNALNIAAATTTDVEKEFEGPGDGGESVFAESPVESTLDENGEDPDAFALPPTVSTYKQKSVYVPPPPNLTVLRRELREALEDARKLMDELKVEIVDDPINSPRRPKRTNTEHQQPQDQQDNQEDDVVDSQQGWYELQGLRVLDLITLAIRAAKNYYTTHEEPSRLYAIRSERNIRSDLFAVLEILKKMAARNFAGGIRRSEHTRIDSWLRSIDNLVTKDEEAERAEHEKRKTWIWRNPNDWIGREREREWFFLKSFDTEQNPLPSWTDPQDSGATKDESGATPFLKELQNGLRLVRLHNEVVRASRRPFEEIKSYHLDTNLPYRMAENLRYWIKAAELRWSTFLHPDVTGVVHAAGPEAWKSFDDALLQWCRAAREELTTEWAEYAQALDKQRNRPVVAIPDEDEEPASPATPSRTFVASPTSISTPTPAPVLEPVMAES